MAIYPLDSKPGQQHYCKIFKTKKMRRSFIIIAVVMFSFSIFSCTTSDLAEEIGIEELATEGEDGEPVEENDD